MRASSRRGTPLALALLLAFASVPSAVHASESTLDDEPAPDSVEGLRGALAEGFEERLRLETFFPRLKDRLKDLPPFLRDTELQLRLRTYSLNRRKTDDTRSAAWAGGGWLAYRSGWWRDRVGVGATLYTSQRLWGPKGKDGTLLLRSRQRGYTELGEAYLKLRNEEDVLTLYRHELDLPYVNRQDSRMTPNTFEGGTLLGRRPRWQYALGHLTRMKKRNADEFVSLSEAAGVPGTSSKGMSFAGLRYSPTESFAVGAIDYHVKDVLNIAYATADYTRSITDRLGLRFQLQFTDQRSVGDDLLTGSPFDTRVWGGQVAASYRYGILTAAFSSTDEEAPIRSPFGSYPGYLSLMQVDFDRAGEDAWGAGLSYVFTRFGLPELSAFARFARGTGASDPETGGSLPDRSEWDLTIDYRPTKGLARGFWLRLRGSLLDEDGAAKKSKEFRIILNYDLPLL